jgi:predicted transcriptional regulator
VTGSTTMTVRLKADTRDKLDRLADQTRRTRSYLAAEAVEEYVARELEIVEGIEEGLADVRAGRLIPHREAMAQLRGAVKGKHKKKA